MSFEPKYGRIRVYLAGDISDQDRWRPKVFEALEGLNVNFLSPVDRIKYERINVENRKNKVFEHCDYLKIDRADVVFCYIRPCASLHSGSSAEIGYAKAKGKLIILVNEIDPSKGYMYEFIKRTADEFFTSLDEGVDYLRALVEEMQYDPTA
jgi:nucleoside 2-deoxyribosyltransferase